MSLPRGRDTGDAPYSDYDDCDAYRGNIGCAGLFIHFSRPSRWNRHNRQTRTELPSFHGFRARPAAPSEFPNNSGSMPSKRCRGLANWQSGADGTALRDWFSDASGRLYW